MISYELVTNEQTINNANNYPWKVTSPYAPNGDWPSLHLQATADSTTLALRVQVTPDITQRIVCINSTGIWIDLNEKDKYNIQRRNKSPFFVEIIPANNTQ